MRHLVTRLGAALLKRDEPLGALAAKVAANVRALGYGRLFLRGCDVVGARARCFGRPRIVTKGSIRIGDDFAVGCAFGTASIAAARDAAITIGDKVTINYGSSIHATRGIHLGDRVLVGPYCVIEDAVIPGAADAAPIHIGSDVWLGARVVVRPGARIGAGSVIAAGSVVEGEIPANAVASGAPARVLRVHEAAGAPDVAGPSSEVHRVAAA